MLVCQGYVSESPFVKSSMTLMELCFMGGVTVGNEMNTFKQTTRTCTLR